MGLNEMKDDEQELLAKLKLQFGDMDVSGMLFTGDGDNYVSNNCDDESESSLEEPTDEELAAWQEAQFAIGQMKLEAKTIISGSNLQRRKTVSERTLLREYEEEEANEWVSIKSVPDLGDVSSIFFPTDDIEGDNNSDIELV